MARRRKASDAAARASAHPPQHIPPGPKIDWDNLMPGYPVRHDGWNRDRAQRFFDTLGHTGCIRDAARVADMSDVAARRAREKYPLFARAWDVALMRAHEGLIAIAYRRAVEGSETIIIRKGEEHERRIKPSDAILRMLVNRGDMLGGGGMVKEDPDTRLTWDEWQAGIRFDEEGGKENIDKIAEHMLWADAKFRQMRKKFETGPHARCGRCDQPWPNRRAVEMPGDADGFNG
jgi:hypothetical protein